MELLLPLAPERSGKNGVFGFFYFLIYGKNGVWSFSSREIGVFMTPFFPEHNKIGLFGESSEFFGWFQGVFGVYKEKNGALTPFSPEVSFSSGKYRGILDQNWKKGVSLFPEVFGVFTG